MCKKVSVTHIWVTRGSGQGIFHFHQVPKVLLFTLPVWPNVSHITLQAGGNGVARLSALLFFTDIRENF
jgi:hypothetical protein